MKKSIITAVALIAFIFGACNNNQEHANTTSADTISTNKAGLVYTCTMHPEVLSDKPGKCPKCKMDLVEKTEGSAADSILADSMEHPDHAH